MNTRTVYLSCDQDLHLGWTGMVVSWGTMLAGGCSSGGTFNQGSIRQSQMLNISVVKLSAKCIHLTWPPTEIDVKYLSISKDFHGPRAQFAQDLLAPLLPLHLDEPDPPSDNGTISVGRGRFLRGPLHRRSLPNTPPCLSSGRPRRHGLHRNANNLPNA